jgi:hypothetical protein
MIKLWKEDKYKGYAFSKDLNLYYFDDFGAESRMEEFAHLSTIYDREDIEEYTFGGKNQEYNI